MNTFQSKAPQPTYRQTLRLEAVCDFAAVREAALFARGWLVAHQFPEAEAGSWELALVEAGNNAVEHSAAAARLLPVIFELSLGETEVEARVTDHTPGFEFPDEVELPDFESEGGRGLFLIKSLTDRAVYLRGAGENQFVMSKRRIATTAVPALDALELQRRLAESEIALNEMTEELATSYESLVAMFRYSSELGKNAELADFGNRLLADLMQLTESDAVVLRLFSPAGRLETFLTMPAGLREQLPPPAAAAVSLEMDAAKTREDLWFGPKQPLAADDPLQAVRGGLTGIVHAFGAGDQTLGTVTLVRCRTAAPPRSAQVNLLHTLVDFLAIQIVNARLLDEHMQSRVTRRELEIAANIQRSLLPLALPSAPPFELAASCTNAREVGGDFYDVLRVGNEGLLLVVADVMGKGVPAAFFAAVLRSTVRSMPVLFSEPAALLTSVNRTLCDDLGRVDMFVTAKVVYLDFARRQIVTASAGHCPLLVWQPGQPVAVPMDDSGLPLGIETNCEYQQVVAPFPAGTTALIYTDGITEAASGDGGMFGYDRLAQLMPKLAATAGSADKLGQALRAELDVFRAGTPLTDDQTFLILHHAL